MNNKTEKTEMKVTLVGILAILITAVGLLCLSSCATSGWGCDGRGKYMTRVPM